MNGRRSITAAILAGVLALPTTVVAEPLSEAAVRIEVDVSALPKADFPENTRQWIVDKQTTALEREGFVVRDDASHVMRIEVSRYGEDGIHTKARLMIAGDPDSVREFTCEACLNSQFLKKVDEETAALAAQLRHDLEEPKSEAEPEPTTEPQPTTAPETKDPEEPQAGSSEPVDHDPEPLGPAGYAGIGALAVGLGVTLGGAVVLAEGPSRRPRPDHDKDIEVTSRAPLGAGLTAAGVALLVTGAALVAVDQTVLRKRRARRARASIVVPVVSPAALGFSWTTRF